jgi:ferredoxin
VTTPTPPDLTGAPPVSIAAVGSAAVGRRWRTLAAEAIAMQVWIDQDCCTGAGLCVDHCPDLFVVLEDGIGYVHDGGLVMADEAHTALHVPRRHEQAAIDAVERCPGECIYLEPDGPPPDCDGDILDAEVVEG